MPEALTSQQIAAALRYATDWLGVYKEQVNALNVYPVPDGDTGTNMHLTMQSIRRELDTCDEDSMPSVAKAIAYGGLLGARGNSGVILSQLFKGFSEAIRDQKTVSPDTLKTAFEQASRLGYAAVMKPVEGTILTVAREVGTGARRAKVSSVEGLLECALKSGQDALEKTPDQLPALKQAGVVDSGGQGYLYILQGMLAYLQDKPLPEAPKIESYAGQQVEHEEFGYCTEFLMKDCTLPIEKVRELVAPYGDSLLVVGAEGYVKGHIHTNEPDELLSTVARHGNMVRTKVEDMSEQHTEILSMAGASTRAEEDLPQSGLVAVASGYGLVKVFRSLGARVVSGGQTQNPSVQDILDAAKSVTAREIIILPNNKNVIMAAQKAAELLGDHVKVLPTRTLGQGMSAAIGFSSFSSAEEQLESMQDSASRVTTLEVTRASRSVELNGLDIQEGGVIGLKDDELVFAGDTPEEAVLEMLKTTFTDQTVATIFTGPNVDQEQIDALMNTLQEQFPDLMVEVHAGGPDLYDYLVTLE
ncbi:DAK2 domain-containing protein [Deinococcus cellulosilyticus]|uniref:Kinase n=1 Tax=Deinococcus cellulosilyticus (strain DSM 18568 / NBRC 106333 / KACC 11606 / 5516J-15) TaxID=1223518 RepID=A0A511MWZ2_DEIC1|nr:DAK2 domain-containing protein [Deinococcus cellulosilyticus]GEM45105.1 kinase [Deinococcus cellulosilyticus NBRC 106333 = KACC 11606]